MPLRFTLWKPPILALLACVTIGTSQQTSLPSSLPASSSPAATLPARETLYYQIEWRLFTAGKAKLDLAAAPGAHAASDGAKPGYQISLHLESAGFVSKLFKVEDDYTAILNAALCAESSRMTMHEGSRQRETKITFDNETRKASYQERDRLKNSVILQQEVDIPPCVHDVIGGLYVIRTLNLEPGQSVTLPVSDGKKSVMARVEAQQREDVKTPAGGFKTVRYEIYLFNGVLYKRSAHLNVWLTDDRRKLPVQIRVRLQFTIGTINLLLEKHE